MQRSVENQYEEGANVRKQLMVLVLLALGSSAAAAQDMELAAKVNGAGISRSTVQLQVDQIMHNQKADYAILATKPGALEGMRQQVLEQLITQELLWQEARRRGRVVEDAVVDAEIGQIEAGFDTPEAFQMKVKESGFTPESFREDLLKRMSVEHMLSRDIANNIAISEQDIDTFYSDNQQQMVIPEQVRISHIMVKGESGEAAALELALTHAKELLSLLREGADFGQLASEKSQAPSASNGGDLGFIERGNLVKAFEDAAFALQVGEISEPVRVGNDYHILKVTARAGGNTVPREQAAEQIEDYLIQQRTQEALEALVQGLRDEASIEIY